MHHLTPNNKRVLDLLLRAGQPLTAYEILDRLRRYGIKSPPIVYRALDALVKHGHVHKIESINSFVACQHCDGKDGHDHGAHDHVSQFAICNSCGTVREIDDPTLARMVTKIRRQFLKQVDKEVFELSGTCHNCADKQAEG